MQNDLVLTPGCELTEASSIKDVNAKADTSPTRSRPRVLKVDTAQGDGDIANLFFAAKRRIEDKSRGSRPSKRNASTAQPRPARVHQTQSEQAIASEPVKPPVPLITEAPKELPKSASKKPVSKSAAARTIRAALPQSDPKPRLATEDKPNGAGRVYSNERRHYDADFDRRLAKDPPERTLPASKTPKSTAALSTVTPERAVAGVVSLRALSPSVTPQSSRQMQSDQVSRHSSSSRRRSSPPRASAAPTRMLFDPRADQTMRQLRQSPQMTERPLRPAKSSSEAPTDAADFDRSANVIQTPPTVGTELPVADRANDLYRTLVDLETVCLTEADNKRKGESTIPSDEESAQGYWLDQFRTHQRLAEAHHDLLLLSSAPDMSPQIQTMPSKCNLPVRLWQHAFHLFLERLRHALTSCHVAEKITSLSIILTDLLIDFIQYAYIFYISLIEYDLASSFKSSWYEQLGDLSKYRMAFAGLLVRLASKRAPDQQLSAIQVEALSTEKQTDGVDDIDDDNKTDDGGSIGDAALGDWDVEDADIWRRQALDWYAQSAAEFPESGRVYQALATLSKGFDMRMLFFACKAVLAHLPSPSASSLIDNLLADLPAAENRPFSQLMHIHNLMYNATGCDWRLQLDSFIENLDMLHHKKVAFSDQEYIFLAFTCLAGLLDYGRSNSVMRNALLGFDSKNRDGSSRPQNIMLNATVLQRRKSDVSDSSSPGQTERLLMTNPTSAAQPTKPPATVDRAAQLLARLLTLFLGHRDRPNIFLTMGMTLLSLIAQHPDALQLIQSFLPWRMMTDLFNCIPNTIEIRLDTPVRVLGLPLPEDWSYRGTAIPGRILFGRGFWKTSEDAACNVEIAMSTLGDDRFCSSSDGLHNVGMITTEANLRQSRWKRIAFVAALFCKNGTPLQFDASASSDRRFSIRSAMDKEVGDWQQRNSAFSVKSLTSVSTDAASDTELEDRSGLDTIGKQQLRQILIGRKRRNVAPRQWASVAAASRAPPQQSIITIKKVPATIPLVSLSQQDSVLVLDETLVLELMPLVEQLLVRREWSLVIPLAVIARLDRIIRSDPAPDDAHQALTIVTKHEGHVIIATAFGNVIEPLDVRSKLLSYQALSAASLDDQILATGRAFQERTKGKVCLVSLNKNRRASARHAGLPALNENDMIYYLADSIPVRG